MANEIQVSLAVVVENGNMKYNFQPDLLNVDQTSIGRGGHVQSVGTTEEILDFGDVLSEGWLILRNLDTTNYVQWGPQMSSSVGAMQVCGRMEPGEPAVYRLEPGIVLMAKANTAACLVDVTVLED